MSVNIYKKLGDQIKHHRLELGLSQEELAHKLGYKSRVTVSKIESGEYKVAIDKLELLARLFKTTISELLGDNGNAGYDLGSVLRHDQGLMLSDIEQVTDFIKFLKKQRKTKS